MDMHKRTCSVPLVVCNSALSEVLKRATYLKDNPKRFGFFFELYTRSKIQFPSDEQPDARKTVK